MKLVSGAIALVGLTLTLPAQGQGEVRWVKMKKGAKIPKAALAAGKDVNGDVLYVARFEHRGGLHVGNVGAHLSQARIGWGGSEIRSAEYEILVSSSPRLKWVAAANGSIPKGAVVCGREADHKALYAARAKIGGSVQVGKIGGDLRDCHFGYDGRELKVRRYEVLVLTGKSKSLTLPQQVDAALSWLARHQDGGGAWKAQSWVKRCKGARCGGGRFEGGSAQHDNGVTALALLALVTAGHSHQSGRYKDSVARALKHLRTRQRPDGSIAFERRSPESIYHHAVATQALALLYAHTKDPGLRDPVTRAAAWCVKSQNPNLGWRYGIRTGKNDTSVTGWMALALNAAQRAGIEVPDLTFAGARRWFVQVSDSKGNAGYMTRGGGSSHLPGNDRSFDVLPTMSAFALLGRLECGEQASAKVFERGRKVLLEHLPSWKPRTINFYYWHAATRVFGFFGADQRRPWKKALEKALGPTQSTAGCSKGSWSPAGEWCAAGGRVFATAINAISLQHLRSSQAKGALVQYRGGLLLEARGSRFEVHVSRKGVRVWRYDAAGKPASLEGASGKVRMVITPSPKKKKKKSTKKPRKTKKPKQRKKSGSFAPQAANPERGRLHGYLLARVQPGKRWSKLELKLTLEGVPGIEGPAVLSAVMKGGRRHRLPTFECTVCRHDHEDPGRCTKCGATVR